VKKITFLLLICFNLLTITARAGEDLLATITNDENQNVFTFIADTSEDNHDIKIFFKDDYFNGKKITRKSLITDDLAKDGLILDKHGEHTIINLKSENFDFQRGGTVTIDTLYNGVTGERRQYEIEIARVENSWKIFNQKNIISKIHIEVNKKMLIGTVGVKNIRME